jgi:hypothetical protein
MLKNMCNLNWKWLPSKCLSFMPKFLKYGLFTLLTFITCTGRTKSPGPNVLAGQLDYYVSIGYSVIATLTRLVISSLISFCYALWMLRTTCYDWGDQNAPLGKDGGLKFVSESLLQKLTLAEQYSSFTSEGYIYHIELYLNTND